MVAAHSHSPRARFLQMIHKVVFVFDRHADRLLADGLNTTFSQFLILLAAAQCPGLSQRDVATFLQITPAAVSRHIDTLVKAQLLSRTEDPNNRRTHTVRLTKKGEEKFNTMQTLLQNEFNKATKNISDAQFETATQTLLQLLIALKPECAGEFNKSMNH